MLQLYEQPTRRRRESGGSSSIRSGNFAEGLDWHNAQLLGAEGVNVGHPNAWDGFNGFGVPSAERARGWCAWGVYRRRATKQSMEDGPEAGKQQVVVTSVLAASEVIHPVIQPKTTEGRIEPEIDRRWVVTATKKVV